MRAYCSVPDCYSPKSKFQLFHIPFNRDLAFSWRRACGSREEIEKWHNAMVCERHFAPQDFYVIPNSKTPGKRRLKRGSVPTLNLPDKAQLAECRRETMEAIKKEKYKDVENMLVDLRVKHTIEHRNRPNRNFQDAGFENAKTAIRAVAEDIEIQSENDVAVASAPVEAFDFVDASGANIKTEVTTEDFQGEERVMALVSSSSGGGDGSASSKTLKAEKLAEQRLEEELSENKKLIMSLKERVLELSEQTKAIHADNAAKKCSIGRKKTKNGRLLNNQDREGILRDVLGKHFSRAQIRCLMKGDWQMGKNWEEKDYKLALTIFTISKRCYHYIRNHHILPLPSYTCLKRHVMEDTPIRKEVEAFLQSESQCNCGQANCQHNLAFPLSTDLSTSGAGGSSGKKAAAAADGPSKEVQLAVMNLLEEQDMEDEDDEEEEDDGGDIGHEEGDIEHVEEVDMQDMEQVQYVYE